MIVLVSGDGDMRPAVEQVIEQGGIWKIEIVGLKETMSADLKHLAANNPDIAQITFLDPDSFSFIQLLHSRKIREDQKSVPPERLPFDFGDMDIHSHGILLQDVKFEDLDWLQREIPKWPFQYQKKVTVLNDGSFQTDILLVFIPPNSTERKKNEEVHFVMDKMFPVISALMEKHCSSIKTYAAASSSREISIPEVHIQNKFIPEADEWSAVKHKKSAKVAGKTSFPCDYHFFCASKLKCKRSHTKEEEDFFKSGKKPMTKKCSFHPNCRKGSDCDYPHSSKDIFCFNCKLRGHSENDCKGKKLQKNRR